MRTARILLVDGPRWLVINNKMYDLNSVSLEEMPKLRDSDYHMSLEAAKNKAYDDGYQAYVYNKKIIKFRRIRNIKFLKAERL